MATSKAAPARVLHPRRFAAGLSLALAATLFAACSKKPPPAVPTTTPDAGADAGLEDAGLHEEPDAAAETGPTFFTEAGAPAGEQLGEEVVDRAIDLAIDAAAAKVAPRMTKEGQPGRATLREGEHFSMMINLMPNRCYTIIGHSPAGSVAQLDLKLFGPPLFNIEAGKSAPGDKSTPVIGKGSTALCPILPVAVPYKLDAAATKGAGRIGIWVFARDK